MKSLIGTAQRLIKGINFRYHSHLVLNTAKFFNKENECISLISVQDSFTNGLGERTNVRIFRSSSMAQVVMFLSTCLASLEGRPLDDYGESFERTMRRNRGWEGVEYLIGEYKDTYSGEY